MGWEWIPGHTVGSPLNGRALPPSDGRASQGSRAHGAHPGLWEGVWRLTRAPDHVAVGHVEWDVCGPAGRGGMLRGGGTDGEREPYMYEWDRTSELIWSKPLASHTGKRGAEGERSWSSVTWQDGDKANTEAKSPRASTLWVFPPVVCCLQKSNTEPRKTHLSYQICH